MKLDISMKIKDNQLLKAHSVISYTIFLRFELKRFSLRVKLAQSKVTSAKIAIFKPKMGVARAWSKSEIQNF